MFNRLSLNQNSQEKLIEKNVGRLIFKKAADFFHRTFSVLYGMEHWQQRHFFLIIKPSLA